jgi:hypothetical protein
VVDEHGGKQLVRGRAQREGNLLVEVVTQAHLPCHEVVEIEALAAIGGLARHRLPLPEQFGCVGTLG